MRLKWFRSIWSNIIKMFTYERGILDHQKHHSCIKSSHSRTFVHFRSPFLSISQATHIIRAFPEQISIKPRSSHCVTKKIDFTPTRLPIIRTTKLADKGHYTVRGLTHSWYCSAKFVSSLSLWKVKWRRPTRKDVLPDIVHRWWKPKIMTLDMKLWL